MAEKGFSRRTLLIGTAGGAGVVLWGTGTPATADATSVVYLSDWVDVFESATLVRPSPRSLAFRVLGAAEGGRLRVEGVEDGRSLDGGIFDSVTGGLRGRAQVATSPGRTEAPTIAVDVPPGLGEAVDIIVESEGANATSLGQGRRPMRVDLKVGGRVGGQVDAPNAVRVQAWGAGVACEWMAVEWGENRRVNVPRRVSVVSHGPFSTPSLTVLTVYVDERMVTAIHPKVVDGPARHVGTRRVGPSQWELTLEGRLPRNARVDVDLAPTRVQQPRDFPACAPMGASVGPAASDRAQRVTGREHSIRQDAVSDEVSAREWLAS